MLSSLKICCAQVPQRWIFAVMACLAMTNAYNMRICLSLTITEMVKAGAVPSSNGTTSDQTCPSSDPTPSSPSSSVGGTYDWDEYTQGIILSSFFWGYIVTQLPGGYLAERFGGKYTFGLGIFSTTIFTLLTPILVQAYGSTGLIVIRVLMGFGEGVTLPAMSFLVAQWAPPNERTKIGTVAISGATLGTVLGNALTGILLEYSPIGWPIVFYFFGVAGVLWFFAWVVLCYNNPQVHPFISDKEKKYIREATNEHTHKQSRPTPWRHILTSTSTWGLLIGKFGFAWAFYTMVTDLPKYMSSVLNFSIKANGYLSALPYLLQLVVSSTSSWLADWAIESGKMSRTNVRKVWLSSASIIPSIFIIAASYAACDRTVVVVLFTVGVACLGPAFSSLMVNPNDLSPNYSGTLMAVGGVIGTLSGILAPYVVGVLTPNQTLAEWRLVFWVTAVVFLSSTLLFDVWGQGEVQSWNNLEAEVDRRRENLQRETAADSGDVTRSTRHP